MLCLAPLGGAAMRSTTGEGTFLTQHQANMPALTTTIRKAPALKKIGELHLSYGVESATTLAELLRTTPLCVPEGQYFASLQNDEVHLYSTSGRIDRYEISDPDLKAGMAIRADGVALIVSSSPIRVLVLHREPVGELIKSGRMPYVEQEDLPALPHIIEYRRLAASGSSDPMVIERMTELLASIQGVYTRESRSSASGSGTSKPKRR